MRALRTILRRGAACLWLVLLLSSAACSEKKPEEKPPPDKAGGFEVSWTGAVSKTYPGDLETCTNATKAALQRLNVSVGKESAGIFKKTLDGESTDGTTVTVQINEVSKTTTRITVKAGYIYGDNDAARRIHSEIEGDLGTRRATGTKWGSFSSFANTPVPATTPPAR